MHAYHTLLYAIGLGSAIAYPSAVSNITSNTTVWPVQSFKTLPSAKPPVLEIIKSGAALAPGYLLFTPLSLNGAVEDAAVMMTDTGELVWHSSEGPFTNLVVQSLDSEPVLSFWTGDARGANGYGYVSILDTTYTEIYRVCPEFEVVTPNNTKFACYADIHESFITERNSVIVTAYNITPADLTSVQGPQDGWVYDSLFYEVDIKTNKTLFRWSALEAGFSISDSKFLFEDAGAEAGTFENPYDWFHINSVQSVGDGYLMNGRHFWTSYKLNAVGDIEWQIEGDTGGDFSLPADGNFSWEHHARVENVTDTSLVLHYMNNFNAGGTFNGSHPSEGLSLHLDLTTNSTTVLKNLADEHDQIYNDAQGTFDPLPNGNTLLGYGAVPSMKEYGPEGDMRMTIRYGFKNVSGMGAQSYRTYRQEWTGTPAEPPAAVVENGTIYLSWNGATGITSWEISAGNCSQNLTTVATVNSTGFETSFVLGDVGVFAKAAAYRGGALLRSTDVVVIS